MQFYSFLNLSLSDQRHSLFDLPLGKGPFTRRVGGKPKERSERVWKIPANPEFKPWTVQPKASRSTDGAILAHPQAVDSESREIPNC